MTISDLAGVLMEHCPPRRNADPPRRIMDKSRLHLSADRQASAGVHVCTFAHARFHLSAARQA
jgi:hypothetical protein